MHRVFVYGTLKRGYGNHQRLLRGSVFVQEASTAPRYRLYDCGYYPCMVEADDGVSVSGEVYEVDDATLAELDRLEGVPYHYQRKSVDLIGLDGVQAYFYQRDISHFRDCGARWDGYKRRSDHEIENDQGCYREEDE